MKYKYNKTTIRSKKPYKFCLVIDYLGHQKYIVHLYPWAMTNLPETKCKKILDLLNSKLNIYLLRLYIYIIVLIIDSMYYQNRWNLNILNIIVISLYRVRLMYKYINLQDFILPYNSVIWFDLLILFFSYSYFYLFI